MHFGTVNADHFKALAIDADVFADGVAAGEKFFLSLRTDNSDARTLRFILAIVKAALIHAQRANVIRDRIFTDEIEIERAVLILNGDRLSIAGADMSDLRNIRRSGDRCHPA